MDTATHPTLLLTHRCLFTDTVLFKYIRGGEDAHSFGGEEEVDQDGVRIGELNLHFRVVTVGGSYLCWLC